MINALVYQIRSFLTHHFVFGFLFSQSFLIFATDTVAQSRSIEPRQTAAGVRPGPNYCRIVYPGEDGRLIYVPDENGNTVLDFSNCGYMGGGVKLPDVAVKRILEPAEGDDTVRIQSAIDEVASLPLDKNGFRGAVLLKRGEYEIKDSINISASGIVLRGEGQDSSGTILYATGTEQRSLIRVEGVDDLTEITGTARHIVDRYVPVGARSFHVETDGHSYFHSFCYMMRS